MLASVSRLIVGAITLTFVCPAYTPAFADSPGPVYLKGLGATASGGVGALASSVADAVPLPASPVQGSLPTQGESDLYAVTLAAGERIELGLSGEGSFDLYLYSPGIDQLAEAVAVAHATEGGYPRTLAYDVSVDLPGTYYIEVHAYSGSGSYSLTWRVRAPAENIRADVDSATDLPIPSTIEITLADVLGANKVFRVALPAGRRVHVDLAGPLGSDFDLYLYAPGTHSILPRTVTPVVMSNTPTSNERFIFDVPPGTTQTYFLEVLRFNGSGTATLRVTHTAIPAAPSATRVWGRNRYETAAAISAKAYPAGSRSVILASGQAFPDGLASASLAGALNAPILLTDPARLPTATLTELRRLRVEKVYIIGGTAAVQPAVADEIVRRIPGVRIERIQGRNRYETAAKVADKTRAITGVRPARVFLASGEAFPDALALSPIAFTTRTPIVLTRKTALPQESEAVISRLRSNRQHRLDVFVAGGEGAVSHSAANTAKLVAGGSLTRAQGPNRYATSLAVAEAAVFAGWVDPTTVAFASGVAFPDALAGAPLPGGRRGALLLCSPAALGSDAEAYLRSFDFAVNECLVLGGTGAVSDPVLTQIRTILPKTPLSY